jgi:uncharacterized ion transporter superfamily protein YfcC
MSEKQSKFHGGVLIFFFAVGIIVSLWVVIRNGWWLPELASEHGAVIDRIFITILVISGVLFILSEFALSFFRV